jgi:hypothetical protein
MKKRKNQRKTSAIKTAVVPPDVILKNVPAPITPNQNFLTAAFVSCVSGLATACLHLPEKLREKMLRMLRRKLNYELQSYVWKDRIAWLREYSLNLALIFCIFALVTVLGATNYLYLTSEPAIETARQQQEYIDKKNDQQEWKRLWKKHGFPAAVIYEEGNPTPYYYNEKKQRCSFN